METFKLTDIRVIWTTSQSLEQWCYLLTRDDLRFLEDSIELLFFSCEQCIWVESTNYFYIWGSRLDELSRSPRSSQANEGPMWNYQGSSGLFTSAIYKKLTWTASPAQGILIFHENFILEPNAILPVGSLSFFSLICRLDTLFSLKIQMDSIQLCCMLVGDFSHLTLIVNPFLKVWNQRRRKYDVKKLQTCCMIHNYRVSLVRRFFWSIKHSLDVTLSYLLYIPIGC